MILRLILRNIMIKDSLNNLFKYAKKKDICSV